jgi:hypothetical protein
MTLVCKHCGTAEELLPNGRGGISACCAPCRQSQVNAARKARESGGAVSCRHCGTFENLLPTGDGKFARVCLPCRKVNIAKSSRQKMVFERMATAAARPPEERKPEKVDRKTLVERALAYANEHGVSLVNALKMEGVI